ncbi:hypothetical protein C0J52_26631 [Blattella germanica]|nr:hypothetical protein C0J52_26631 [Blattella germanica]
MAVLVPAGRGKYNPARVHKYYFRVIPQKYQSHTLLFNSRKSLTKLPFFWHLGKISNLLQK